MGRDNWAPHKADAQTIDVDIAAAALAHSRVILSGHRQADIVAANPHHVELVIGDPQTVRPLGPNQPAGARRRALPHFDLDEEASAKIFARCQELPCHEVPSAGGHLTLAQATRTGNEPGGSGMSAGMASALLWHPDSPDGADDRAPRFTGEAVAGRRK
jgi:hypothetical protein